MIHFNYQSQLKSKATFSNLLSRTLNISFFLVAFMLLNFNLSGQSPSIEWEKKYGGSLGDRAESVQQTDDGGYIMAGSATSDDGDVSGNNGSGFGSISDYWLVKIDASGNIQWEGNYGGSNDDEAYSVQQTNDGGYIVAGETNSDDVDVSGNNGTGTFLGADFWLVKLDSSGTIQWEGNYGGSNGDEAYSVQQTNDGGYIVAGESISDDGDVSGNNGQNDFWVLKLDASGTILWEGNYGGSDDDRARSIQQTDDGGYIVAGESLSDDGDISENNGGFDYWVVKLDASGTILWEGNYGGSDDDRARSIQQTDDGGYIVAGETTIAETPSWQDDDLDYWLVKLDTSGTILWEENYGGSDYDVAYSVQQTDDGGYIMVGESNSDDGDVSGNNGNEDYWLVKVNASGTIQWEENYGGGNGDIGKSVQQTDDGGYILAGSYLTNYWAIKLSGTLSMENPSSNRKIQSSLYPNPTSNNITVEANGAKAPLTVFLRDITGRSVSEHKIENPSSFQIEIAREAGIYMLELKDAAGRKTTRKVIKK